MKHYDRVFATVNLDAIFTNVENMKKNIVDKTQILAVIKADGYGHGAVPIAHELKALPYLFGFAVATPEEAMILRKSGIEKPILILGYTFPYAYETMIEQNIRMTVFRIDMIEEIEKCAKKLNKKAKVHIKVDTGMTRIGMRPDESGVDFVKNVMQKENIEIEGIFTHFARADEIDKTYANEQIAQFKRFTDEIEKKLNFSIPLKHCSNSAGIIELKNANMDIVRAGITLYGLWPSGEVKKNIVTLIPALSLQSHIVYIKEVEPDIGISYGSTYITDKLTRVATIPVGYGDGYPRGLSNKGHVLIHGQRAPILGRVCMDQFMVDVTDILEAKEGDLVTLIGKDGENIITAEEIGDISKRFNYELVCDLGKRIPRVYVKAGKVIKTKDYFEDFS